MRGTTPITVAVVSLCGLWGTLRAEPAPPALDPASLPTAIEKGLARVQAGASNYLQHRDCFSCHHQAMPILTLALADQHGYEIDPEVLRQQVEFTLGWFQPKVEQMEKGDGVPGAATTAGYALLALSMAEHPADDTTDALLEFLMKRRREQHWVAVARRPPAEISPFTATALAIRGLKHFGRTEGHLDQARAVTEAIAWLRQAEPETTEDRVFRLWGLHEAGTDPVELQRYRDDLLAQQRDDGGWGQTPEMPSDAYATGQSLAMLRWSGLPADSPAYQKGLRYLLATQQDDGSWFVQTRSRPVQVFFDNGDPGGESQFISFAATNWATSALILASQPDTIGGGL